MASRGGFLVGDGSLYRKNTSKKQNSTSRRVMTKKKRKPEWDVRINIMTVYSKCQKYIQKSQNRRNQVDFINLILLFFM